MITMIISATHLRLSNEKPQKVATHFIEIQSAHSKSLTEPLYAELSITRSSHEQFSNEIILWKDGTEQKWLLIK